MEWLQTRCTQPGSTSEQRRVKSTGARTAGTRGQPCCGESDESRACPPSASETPSSTPPTSRVRIERQDVGEVETVAKNDLTHLHLDRLPEDRAIIDERVKFAVLTARIHSGG